MTRADEKDIAVAALKRASQVARSGSVRAQAGRFDELDALKSVAKRVLINAQGAIEAWSQWEAINDLCANPPVRESADSFGALGAIRLAMARDALLTSYRLTDPSEPDSETLTRLAIALHDAELARVLASCDWALDVGHSKVVAAAAAERNKAASQHLAALLVPNWAKQTPADATLIELRQKLKPVRDRILAHSFVADDVEHLVIDEQRQFIDLVYDLAHEAALLFVGSASSKERVREVLSGRARRFWSAAFAGVLADKST